MCLVPPANKGSDNKQQNVTIASLVSFIIVAAALTISCLVIKKAKYFQRQRGLLMDDKIEAYSIDHATDDNITALTHDE